MKGSLLRRIGGLAVTLLLLLLPVVGTAAAEQPNTGPPPIGQQMVREGTYAVKLIFALALGTTEDEAEAESKLAEVGIVPRNGWIADYPVTPDIVAELRQAVGDAAEAGKLTITREEAVERFDALNAEVTLPVRPYTADSGEEGKPVVSEAYPNPTVINNYYYEQGPPVVTYYAPPPDYYYLYGWVPYPFWWAGFWFPGFFVLNDFHKVVVVNRRTAFISNHFNDIRNHRVFRVDPVARFRGRTFAGIGVSHPQRFISTGVPRSDRRIFNGTRQRFEPGGRAFSPAPHGGRSFSTAPHGGRSFTAPPRGSQMMSPATRGGRTGMPMSRGGGGGSGRGRGR